MDKFEALTHIEIMAAEALLVQKVTKKSLEDISTEIGISRRHLFDIRQKTEFKAFMKRRALEQASDDIHEVIHVLKAKAKKGDIKAIRTLFEVADLFPNKKLEVKQEINATHSRSSEEIEADRMAIQRELEEMKLMN
ncbi:phBC6A51 family helix-turn-helix protein [Peribacillus frigoritolerans]|uniref:PhBC6A51 family helix-turn-helix protein n=1 Tax=Peribacillus frigoritolerans TaxID=450367 RepID=A0AAJ1QKI9_9BACI|nr:phBC6A51 family helix-turn-helix protein [Peribacillus frigoritolerans]MDM5283106.1 phBC6A51 family helix-turn-helix protein [Peribacillus frigoritolerans]